MRIQTMRFAAALAAAAMITAGAAAAWADQVYIQIEARRGQDLALERAQDWAQNFADLQGFALPGGWFGLALGPIERDRAEARIQALKAQGAIPADSFIADGQRYGDAFWPAPDIAAPEPAATESAPTGSTLVAPAEPPAPDPAELRAIARTEARTAEATLDHDARMSLQRALAFAGFYKGLIDGDFGPGTRNAIGEWQAAQGAPVTGLLTQSQMDGLIESRRAGLEAMGLAPLNAPETGIAMEAPMGLVAFDRLAPPFAIWRATQDSGVEMYLFSRAGGREELGAMADLIAALDILPADARRTGGRTEFTLSGDTGTVTSFAEGRLQDGMIHGFVLVWPQADRERRDAVLAIMRDSFAPLEGPGIGLPKAQDLQVSAKSLWEGVGTGGVRASGSGFYVGPQGQVLTAAALVQSCARLTLDGQDARLLADDPDHGLALVAADRPTAPSALGWPEAPLPAPGAPVALAGYSWPGALPSAIVTMGRMQADPKATGTPGLATAIIPHQTGDTGGPVMTETGAVAGLLMPQTPAEGQILPPDLAPVQTAGALAAFLTGAGLTAPEPGAGGSLSPADLAARGRDITVEISCY